MKGCLKEVWTPLGIQQKRFVQSTTHAPLGAAITRLVIPRVSPRTPGWRYFCKTWTRGELWQSKGHTCLRARLKSPRQPPGRAQDPADFVNVSDGPIVPVCDSDAAVKEGDVYQPSRKSTYTPSTRPASEADGAKNSYGSTKA